MRSSVQTWTCPACVACPACYEHLHVDLFKRPFVSGADERLRLSGARLDIDFEWQRFAANVVVSQRPPVV